MTMKQGEDKMSFFDKIKSGLSKTRAAVTGQLEQIFSDFRRADESFFEELEETLILADVGVSTSLDIVENLRKQTKERKLNDSDSIKKALEDIIADILIGCGSDEGNEQFGDTTKAEKHPKVILVVVKWSRKDYHHWKDRSKSCRTGQEGTSLCGRYIQSRCSRSTGNMG